MTYNHQFTYNEANTNIQGGEDMRNSGYCYYPKYTRECIATYSSTFKLYEISYYRLYMVCPLCGCEFDCDLNEICPYCENNPGNPGNPGNPNSNPPQPGFVFLPELLLPADSFALFPELAFEL